MLSRTALKFGSKRRLKPTISSAPVSSTTARQSRTRCTSRSIGFSQKIALPARAACSIRSECMSVGVVMNTALMSSDAMISSIERTCAPWCGELLGGSRDGVGDGGERDARCRRDRGGVHLADAAGAEQSDGE
jgi:hypothetical protein